MPARSSDPHDYQTVGRAVAAMPKDFPPGSHVPPHRHPRAQLLYAVAGIMRVSTPEGSWVVPPHRAVWIPPETEHEITMSGAVAMRTLYIDPRASSGSPARCTVLAVPPLLRELILAAMQEPVEYPSGSRGDAIAALLLHEINAVEAEPLHLPLPRHPRLAAVCRRVVERIGGDETLDALARDAGLSTRTLARLFQRETGMSFLAWRQQARLAEALTRLASGQPSTLVAQDVGYASPSAFAAMFRRMLGTTPARYFGRTEPTAATTAAPKDDRSS